MNSKIHGNLTPLWNPTPEDIQQNYVDTCAVKSQQIIMKSFGIDIPEDILALESEIKGYYMPGYGSDPEKVGQLLNDHGIPTHTESNANIYDLVGELAKGHQVIVGVDADELWRPSFFNDLFGEEANHALVLTGIDTTDPNDIKVIVTDPGSGDVAKIYSMDQFMDAWHDSNCFYVATDNAPSADNNPSMANFDYDLGHLPYIGYIPFDSFMPMIGEFDVFHQDMLQHMEDCLNNLNGYNSEYLSNHYDEFLSVEKAMQNAWQDVYGTSLTPDIGISELISNSSLGGTFDKQTFNPELYNEGLDDIL